jgi:protein-S-isoprenylcysteine O-methyltransferase Ste14
MLKLKIPPPVYMLIFAISMWLMNQYIPLIEWVRPPWNQAGFIIMGLAFFTDLSSLFLFFKKHTSLNPIHPERASILVTGGMYRFSRNPMYLGLLILLSGWAVYLGSISPIFLLPLFIWVITHEQIQAEEQILEEKFGPAYLTYKQRVRRWI